MIDFIFHSSPCKIYIFYAFTVIYPSIKKDIELELELEKTAALYPKGAVNIYGSTGQGHKK